MGILNNNILTSGSIVISGNLDMNGYQINNLATPTSPNDAVTKQYADDLALSGGAVSSVFGRAGAVIAASGDYNISQITNAGTILDATSLSGDDNTYYPVFVSGDTATTPYINSNFSFYNASDSNPALLIGNIEISSSNGIFSLSGTLILSSNGGGGVGITAGSLLIYGGNALRIYNNVSGNYVGLKVNGSLSTTYTVTWPTTSPTNGYTLTTDGSGNLSWSNGVSPSGTASGDLDGSYPSPTVAKINGATLGDTTALEGNILVADSDGGSWVSVAMSGDAGLDGTGQLSIKPNVVTTDMLIGADADTSSLFIVNPTQTANTGNYNTAFGYQAFQTNVSSIENCAFGYNALNATNNTSENGYSSAFGSNALANQTTGENDAFGEYALFNTTTGTDNCGFGGEALYYNIVGSDNTAIGAYALYNCLSNSNAALGQEALLNATTGDQNTAIGCIAGDTITTGSNNTFVGYDADATANNLTNAAAIGAGSRVSISNAIVLGNGSCNVGIGTSSPSTPLHVVGNVTITGDIVSGGWQGTAIGTAYGGTGQTTYTNGQLLIGNTTGNTLAKATLTGTTNQIIVTNGAGSITLSTPQDIGIGSSPTFSSITLSSGLSVPSGGTGATTFTANGLLVGNGTSPITAINNGTTGQILTTTTGSNPSWTNTTYPSTTVLGDILYASAANTLSRLAGNTTTTTQYLTQTGNGTISAAPVWSSTVNATGVSVTNTTSLGRCNVAFINGSSGTQTVYVDDSNLNYNPSTATFRLGNNNSGTAAINLTTSIGVNNAYGSGAVGVTNRLFAGAFNGGETGLVSNGAASAYNGITANSCGIYVSDKNFVFTTNAGSGSTYNTAYTINNVNRTFIFGAGIRYPITPVSGTYTILVTDSYIAVDTSAARSLTLPSASAAGVGATFIVYDSTGNAGANNITVNRDGSDTINGLTNKAINGAYQGIQFTCTTSTTWNAFRWTGA